MTLVGQAVWNGAAPCSATFALRRFYEVRMADPDKMCRPAHAATSRRGVGYGCCAWCG